MNDQQMTALETKMATDRGREALRDAKDSLERHVKELTRYLEHYDEAEDLRDKANYLRYAIGHCAGNIIGNLRLDIMAAAQSELTSIHDRKREQER